MPLDIQDGDDRPVTGGGGQIKILAGKLGSLAVGDAAVSDHLVGTGEFLSALSKAVGAELDGIIGYGFLNQFSVTMNYPGSTLELVPAASTIEILWKGNYS